MATFNLMLYYHTINEGLSSPCAELYEEAIHFKTILYYVGNPAELK